MNSDTVAFIGAGKISETWIERLIISKEFSSHQIMACDPSKDRRDYLNNRYAGLKTSADNADGARFGSFVVIATPPPDAVPTLAAISPVLQPGVSVISLAAGAPLQKLVSAAPAITVLRVMPNTPSMVGEGMNLVCYPEGLTPEAHQRVEWLLSIFGKSLLIEERDMEAYGALCSVGPTFLFPILQSMIDSAVAAGLSKVLARKAAAQVFLGTGKLVADTQLTVAELNGMIGLHTLRESEAVELIAGAYKDALGKLKGLAVRISAVA